MVGPNMVSPDTDSPSIKPVLYLSDKRTLFVGPLRPVLVQSHAASTLILSVDKQLTLLDEADRPVIADRCFLLPAGIELSMDTHDSIVLVCFLDALGQDLAVLSSRLQQSVPVGDQRCYFGLPGVEALVAQAQDTLARRPSAEELFSWLDQWIGQPQPGREGPSDDRVTKAVAVIKRNYSHNDAIDNLAREVCLSVPRLAQLFRQITGIPIRRYRLWHRLYMTVLGISQGLPLSEAALQAGFSDYAHFSRAFKSIGGVNPSEVLSGKNAMDIRVLPPSVPDAHDD